MNENEPKIKTGIWFDISMGLVLYGLIYLLIKYAMPNIDTWFLNGGGTW